MSVKRTLRTLALCTALFIGNSAGMYMTPEEVEDLLAQSSQPKVAHVLKEEREDGDDLLRRLGVS